MLLRNRESTSPNRYNLRSLIVRRVGTLMTVLGVALTVAVFVSVLAMVHGLESTFVDSGEPLNLILIRQSSPPKPTAFSIVILNRPLKPPKA